MSPAYYLCTACWNAWHGERHPCECGNWPTVCSPWGIDGANWYQAATYHKTAGIRSVLRTNTHWKWRSLARASRAKGREIGRVA